MPKEIKVGVQHHGGPPPGYLWQVLILENAYREAKKFLDDAQYDHVAMQVKELAREQDPSHSQTVDVRTIEDYLELRDKGGILGKLNVRVFFFLDKTNQSLVVLGAINKQNDGPTPAGDRKRMARLKRKYLAGDYGTP